MCIYEKYLQLKYTVSMPEKNLDLLDYRGCVELLGNEDVSIVHAYKY